VDLQTRLRQRCGTASNDQKSARILRRSNTKLDRFAFRLRSKKTKRLTASTASIRQALNC
jgi:hypothetical protein